MKRGLTGPDEGNYCIRAVNPEYRVPGESLGLSSRGGRDKINIVNKVYQDTH